MARVCMVTGRGTTTGNNVAHCNKKTRRTFKVNLFSKKFWSEIENRWIHLSNVSQKGIRLIDKKGFDIVLAELRANGFKG